MMICTGALKIVAIATVVATVSVAITLGIIYGTAPLTSENILCRGIGNPDHLQIVPTNTSVVITWAQPIPSGNCTVLFELSFYINDEHIGNSITNTTTYTLHKSLKLCSTFRTELKAITTNQLQSQRVMAETNTEIDVISKIIVENEVASWFVSGNNSACTFQIRINNEIIEESTNIRTHILTNVSPCAVHNMTIIPIHFNGNFGKPYANDFEIRATEIEDFKLIEEDGMILAKWNHIYDKCLVTIIFDENHRYDGLYGGEAILNDANFEHCILYNVTAKFVSETGITGLPTNKTFEMEIGEVDFIITEEDDTIIASWNHIYDKCSVSIKFDETHRYDSLYGGQELLDASQFHHCILYNATANFVPQSGTPGPAISETFEMKIGKVEDFMITEDDDMIVASWNHTYDICSVSIKFDETHRYDSLYGGRELLDASQFRHCILYNATANFVPQSGIPGPAISETFEMKIGEVEDFMITEENDTIVASWNHIYDNCTVSIIFDETHRYDSLYGGRALLDASQLQHCILHNLTAKFVPQSGIVGPAISETFEMKIGKVENFVITEENDMIVASWNHSYDKCSVSIVFNETHRYDSLYGGRGLLDASQFQHCILYNVTAKFVPQIGGAGPAINETFEMEIGVVEDFIIIEEDDIIAASWNHIYDKCSVSIKFDETHRYDGLYGGQEFLTASQFQPCILYNATANFVPQSGVAGPAISETFEMKIAEVEDFMIVEENDMIVANWNHIYDNCTVSIKFDETHRYDGLYGGQEFLTASQFQPCILYNATANFVPQSGIAGPAISETFEMKIGEVEDFMIAEENDMIVANWNHLYDNCTVSIKFDETHRYDGLYGGQEFLTASQFHHCILYNATAKFVPQSGIAGPAISETFEMKIGEVEDFMIAEENDMIVANWNHLYDNCTVSIKFDETHRYDGLYGGEALLTASQFQPCILYNATANFVPQSGIAGPAISETFEMKIGEVEDFMIAEENDMIVANWNHLYDNCTVSIEFDETHRYDGLYGGHELLDASQFQHCILYNATANFVPQSGIAGPAISETFEMKIGEVEDFIIAEENDMIVANWNHVYDNCTVSIKFDETHRYDGLYGGQEFLTASQFQPCILYNATANFVPQSGVAGPAISETFEMKIGEVEDFMIAEENDMIVANWNHLYDNCTVSIEFDETHRYDGLYGGEALLTASQFQPCILYNATANFVPQSGVAGPAISEPFEMKIGEVEDFMIAEENDMIVANWNHLYDNCTVSIKFDETHRYDGLYGGEALLTASQFQPCILYNATANFVPQSGVAGPSISEPFEMKIGEVEDFMIAEENDMIVANWNHLYDNCTVSIEFDETHRYDGLYGGEALLTASQFQPCILYNATANFVPQSGVAGPAISEPFEMKIGEVEDFMIAEENDMIVANWNHLYDNCTVSIKFDETHRYDGLYGGEALLTASQFQPCILYNATANFVPQSGVAGPAISEPFEMKIGEVEDFMIAEENDMIVANWNHLYDNCTVSIEFDETHRYDGLYGGEALLTASQFQPCILYNATANFVPQSGVAGPAISEPFEMKIGEVEDFMIAEENDMIVANWNHLYDNCTVSIKFDETHRYDGLYGGEALLTASQFQPCILYNATANFVPQSGVAGPSISEPFEMKIGKVEDFMIAEENDMIVANWNHLYDNCTVSIEFDETHRYDGLYGGYELLDASQFQHCILYNATANFVPQSGIPGPAISETFEMKIGEVEDFMITEENDMIVASWNHIYDNCTVSIIFDETHREENLHSGRKVLNETLFEHCILYNIDAKFVPESGSAGLLTNTTFEMEFQPIYNLTLAVSGNLVNISWELIGNIYKCNFYFNFVCSINQINEQNAEVPYDSDYHIFKECEIDLEANTFSMEIKPIATEPEEPLNGVEVYCAYNIIREEEGDKINLSLKDDGDSNTVCPNSSEIE